MVEVIGFPAPNINFCPRCGSENNDYNGHWQMDGLLRCKNCKCVVFIIQGEDDESEGK